ncbi:PAS domain S-box protein [Candidatus Saccharibacteria bacterium]|nr:PAS domain S-box protein [Candidatus Saccharibacteria bacterium]
MSQILTLINLIHSTGQFKSYYMIVWAALVLIGGMLGLYVVIGSSFVLAFYFVVISTNASGGFTINYIGLSAVIGTAILGTLSYYLFKRFYVSETDAKISKLSGALKSKQLQSEILIQSIADGVIVTTTDGKISSINHTASAMTGWAIEEAVGIDVMNVVKLKQETGEEILSNSNPFTFVLAQKQATNNTYQLESRDKKTHIVSFVVSPVLIEKSQELAGTVAVIRDVSAAKAEEQRRADFISTASHEMRTPVAAIEGYLALALNDRVSKIDAKARSYLEKAHSSTQHLGKLFQDLLTSAKAEDGRLVSHPVVVEMGTFLEQLSDTLRFSAEKKGLLVEFTIGTSNHANDASGSAKVIKPLYYTHADPDRMREVITNLFDNAVKYTEKGKISIGLTGNNELVQFYVRDTGPGIPKEDIPHLFQKFYRVDNSSTRTIGGTGLGLFICQKIVQLYNGRIWVDSEVDNGSTFYINLPRLSSQKAKELQTAEASQKSLLT